MRWGTEGLGGLLAHDGVACEREACARLAMLQCKLRGCSVLVTLQSRVGRGTRTPAAWRVAIGLDPRLASIYDRQQS